MLASPKPRDLETVDIEITLNPDLYRNGDIDALDLNTSQHPTSPYLIF